MVVKVIYKVIRSIIFSVTLFVVGIYVLAYILLSIPAFTGMVKDRATRELTSLLGSEVKIESLNIYPFNEIRLTGLEVFDMEGRKCLGVETVGGGISLWRLLWEGRIELTYGEIIGPEILVVQDEKGSPYNINFIIDAFSSKDKNKEKKSFHLALRNVVIRKGKVSFKRPWLEGKMIGALDPSNVEIKDLAADILFPEISDKRVEVDLRRLSFGITNVTKIEKIALKGFFSSDKIDLNGIEIKLPLSRIYIPELAVGEEGMLPEEFLATQEIDLEITESYITPRDLSFLNPAFNVFSERLPLEISMKGNQGDVKIENFSFGDLRLFGLNFKGEISGLKDFQSLSGNVPEFNLNISEEMLGLISQNLIPSEHKEVADIIERTGTLNLTGEFAGSMADRHLAGRIECNTEAFRILAEGNICETKNDIIDLNGEINIEDFNLKTILPKNPIGRVNATIIADGTLHNNSPEGMVSVVVDDFEYQGTRYDGFSLNLNKEGDFCQGDLLINNAIAEIEAVFEASQNGKEKEGWLEMKVEKLLLSDLVDMHRFKDYVLAGEINLNGAGSNIDDITGDLNLKNFMFISPDAKHKLHLKQLNLVSEVSDSVRHIDLDSDWVAARVEGDYRLSTLPAQIKGMIGSVFPALISRVESQPEFMSSLEFDLQIKHNNTLTDFFNLPVRLLVPVNLGGTLDGNTNSCNLVLNLPYLQQGRDKLIYDTKFFMNIYGDKGIAESLVETTVPVKRGDLSLNINLYGENNSLDTDLRWVNTENSDFKGHVVLNTNFVKNEFGGSPEILVNIRPSVLDMGDADWQVANSTIKYSDNSIAVEGLKIWHDNQFVEISGKASKNYEDVVHVSLADIDVDYVFEMLGINYVTFGGTATGEISGHSLLSSDPVAETESFRIENLSYNGCVIGDGIITSRWNNEEKEVEISADISKNGLRRVYGYGGIWLGRDSLCFDIQADKVPVDFIQPFMAVFSSHVGGFATGDVKLFGTFHDIDMTGKIFADSVAVKLDYTNTVYHGSDSVFLDPGRIVIPGFTLYDKYGNSSYLTGELTHRYFHDPAFTFRLSDANNFLCYDTGPELNPDWYGTLFGTGSALLKGEPGIVDISADMTVGGNSAFTFVLNETEYAQDYQFLTFSDKRGAQKAKTEVTAADIKALLKKKMTNQEESHSKFGIDIRATVTQGVLFTLVMDPAAGDKITARGRGAMQVKYDSDNDEMAMYGKYEIDEGNYNFSLQDIILRDFKIKEGSSISFNGNPLTADLDISATYRVNTNLSDLDKSFSTDRDLNRTNVPVDAVLSVTGNMQEPDITFDIELPTLTQDVERKVKSIISTDDMMNRQIIYLLALNRFYTPEYMGSGSNGGELAAVASTTISSQLSNILGQLTDKFSVSPSFRSDKGDFSDIEVDVALSSRLLNNRLLINGNFGYRDRSNSSTTFVGDFDVEYLLSKNGNLRLKAYNHFNDQNYYLREALTTQGLGVIYRRDFDNWFTFLKPRKREKTEETNEKEVTKMNENEGVDLKEEDGTEN